jgi:glutamate synthase domain-containing protein 2
MARVCHTNNCPVGVATQREELRARFPGTPADVVNYFAFVAEEVGPCVAWAGPVCLSAVTLRKTNWSPSAAIGRRLRMALPFLSIRLLAGADI